MHNHMLDLIPTSDNDHHLCRCSIPTSSTSTYCARDQHTTIRDYEARRKREQCNKAKLQRSNVSSDERKRKIVCHNVAMFFSRQTAGMDTIGKRDILSRLLKHLALKDAQLQETKDEASVQATLLSGVCNTYAMVKQPKSSDELFFKRCSLMMLVNDGTNGSSNLNISATSRVLNISRRNFYATKSRLLLKEYESLPLSTCCRQPRSSTITQEMKDLVFSFWSMQTHVSPNKKDVCRKQLGRKSYVQHPVHLLDVPQVILFSRSL